MVISAREVRVRVQKALFESGLSQLVMKDSSGLEHRRYQNRPVRGMLFFDEKKDRACNCLPMLLIYDEDFKLEGKEVRNIDEIVEKAQKFGANSYVLGKGDYIDIPDQGGDMTRATFPIVLYTREK